MKSYVIHKFKYVYATATSTLETAKIMHCNMHRWLHDWETIMSI